MSFLIYSAHQWFYDNGKHPSQTETGHWRWVLPDPPTSNAPDELPGAVFYRLTGGDPVFPWLFATPEEAIDAALSAIRAAMYAGWMPRMA